MHISVNMKTKQCYYSSVEEVINHCATNVGCIIVVDQFYLKELVAKDNGVVGRCSNQIIVIDSGVEKLLEHFAGERLLLVAASNLSEAVRFTFLAEDFGDQVFYIVKEEQSELKEIMELLAD